MPPFDFNSYSTGTSHVAQPIKHLPAMRETWVQYLDSIPGSGGSPGGGNGNPLQYSGLENPMDGGAWQATVHAIARVGHELALSFFLLSSYFITIINAVPTHPASGAVLSAFPEN